MTEPTLTQNQQDMRHGYLDGAPGVLVSGLVWVCAGVVAVAVSQRASVLALLLGGMLIFPLSLAVTKLLGRPGTHGQDNPLGKLALEGTFWMLAGIAIAYGVQALRLEWFFPAMMLVIGGRYLTFQTLYGLRAYWVLGAVLCITGILLALLRVPATAAAFAGGIIELSLGAFLLARAKRAA